MTAVIDEPNWQARAELAERLASLYLGRIDEVQAEHSERMAEVQADHGTRLAELQAEHAANVLEASKVFHQALAQFAARLDHLRVEHVGLLAFAAGAQEPTARA